MNSPQYSTPTVALIIVTYNSGAYLPELFQSLRTLRYPSTQWGIIVIDNASTDNSVQLCRELSRVQPDLTITIQENTRNQYFAAANNQAVSVAHQLGYEYVFLLNPDTVIDPLCVGTLTDVLTRTNVTIAQARLMLYPKESGRVNSLGNEIHFLGFGYSRDNGSYWNNDAHKEAVWPITYPSGAAMMIATKKFMALGGFDETLEMYHEDLELGWRVLEQKETMVCVKDAIVYHKYSFYPAAYKYFFMERNRYIVLFSHYRLRTLLVLMPALACIELGILLFCLRNGWWKEKLRSYVSLLKNTRTIITLRHQISLRTKVSDRVLLNYFRSTIEDQPIENVLLRRVGNPAMRFYYRIITRCIYW